MPDILKVDEIRFHGVSLKGEIARFIDSLSVDLVDFSEFFRDYEKWNLSETVNSRIEQVFDDIVALVVPEDQEMTGASPFDHLNLGAFVSFDSDRAGIFSFTDGGIVMSVIIDPARFQVFAGDSDSLAEVVNLSGDGSGYFKDGTFVDLQSIIRTIVSLPNLPVESALDEYDSLVDRLIDNDIAEDKAIITKRLYSDIIDILETFQLSQHELDARGLVNVTVLSGTFENVPTPCISINMHTSVKFYITADGDKFAVVGTDEGAKLSVSSYERCLSVVAYVAGGLFDHVTRARILTN